MIQKVLIVASHFDDRFRIYCCCYEMHCPSRSHPSRGNPSLLSAFKIFSLCWIYNFIQQSFQLQICLPSLRLAVLFQPEVSSFCNFEKSSAIVFYPLTLWIFPDTERGLNMYLQKKLKKKKKMKANMKSMLLHITYMG